MRPILFLILILATIPVLAQKTKDHTTVVTAIAENIQAADFGKTPVRLAIVTFVPLQGKPSDANVFGEYLTESVIGRLSTNPDKVKLFERKRIDAILSENEFMLSGMIKASEAIRIGELLPIDALFSGTYTKLKNYVDVTGRLIDVASGEILMSYTGRIRLTKNIKTLFPESAPVRENSPSVVAVANDKTKPRKPEETKADIEARCRMHTDKFREKLHDLSTSGKVDALVAEAIQTPFENTCGKLHYHFISALTRYSLYPPSYAKFLLSTLDTIAYPSGDDRAYTILSYLTKDRQVSDAEWKSGVATIKKVGDYTLSAYIGFMFNRVESPDSAALQTRIDYYFSALRSGQIGLPRAIPFDKGFYEAMEGLSDNLPLRMYVYGKYADGLVTEADQSAGLHLMYLKRMYDEDAAPSTKTKVISWIGDYFNKHVNAKTGDQLYDVVRDFVPYPNDEGSSFKIDRNKEAALKYPEQDLAVFLAKCGERFARYATETRYPGQREDRINFCARYGIPIPGVIPTVQEAEIVLLGSDIAEQHRIMKLLLLMDEQVAPLENTFVSVLGRRSIENREKLAEIQTMALEMLGTLRTRNQKAIAQMIASLKNYDRAAEISTESLVSIGKPAVGPLIEQLNATTIHDGGLQYRLIVILGRIGNDASAAAPSLHSLLTKTTNKDIRYAIEAALQTFGQ